MQDSFFVSLLSIRSTPPASTDQPNAMKAHKRRVSFPDGTDSPKPTSESHSLPPSNKEDQPTINSDEPLSKRIKTTMAGMQPQTEEIYDPAGTGIGAPYQVQPYSPHYLSMLPSTNRHFGSRCIFFQLQLIFSHY
jgi:hypothetical protein